MIKVKSGKHEEMEMMKKTKKSILMLAAMGVFLISGCSAKEEVPQIPSETFVDEVLLSAEQQTTVANETQSITSDEAQIETLVQSEEPAKAESVSEPKPDNEQKPAATAQTAPAKAQEPAAAQTAPAKAQEPAAQTAPAKEIKYVNITHIFKPYEQAVEISLQIPEDWKYTTWDADEESPDWGYSVDVCGRDDANVNIYGQHGTMTADDPNGPKSFQTSQGLTGQYFWDEYTRDDGNPAVQGMIVFDTELAGFYGVSFNMPKSIYSENKDIIDKVFQSIVIKEVQ